MRAREPYFRACESQKYESQQGLAEARKIFSKFFIPVNLY